MDRETWRPYAERLLVSLQADGLVGRSELQKAYWAYPRHEFIQDLYIYDASSFTFRRESAPGDSLHDESWLDRIYRDEPIIVRLDAAGTPDTCNLTPSLAFRILDRIGVDAGDSILEIGTGTGQLTGMLGELAGSSGDVTSLEADPELVERARHRLARFDQKAPTEIVEVDALTWRPDAECFDIVVATRSCWPLPEGWVTSLVPDGRVCAEIRGKLSGAWLLARRTEEDSGAPLLTGKFADKPAGLLPLRRPQDASAGSNEIPLDFVFDEASRMPADGLGAQQFIMNPFAWYCQLELPEAKFLHIPSGEDGQLEAYLLTDDGMDAVRLPVDGSAAGEELVSFGGVHELIERLASAWRDWQDYGCPVQAEYSFSVEGDGAQTVGLKGRERRWRL